MKEFAAMMKNADRLTATATIQMQARWMRRGSRLQPKIHNPRKVDSKKNAAKRNSAKKTTAKKRAPAKKRAAKPKPLPPPTPDEAKAAEG